MTVVRSMVIFERASGLPEDRIVNTFHAETSFPLDNGMLDDWHDKLVSFYNSDGGGDGIHAYLSNVLSRLTDASMIKTYDLSDAIPRPVVRERLWTLGAVATGGTPYPSEVACCATYEATREAGVPMDRRRGRIYLGPLVTDSAAGGTSDPRPSVAFRQQICARMESLAGIDATGLTWSLYSPTTDQGRGATATRPAVAAQSLESSAFHVVSGWSDNAFDTQRRRGNAATDRITWP